MNLTTLRRRRGFTLLELIVVLIVLGLLAAIAIPTYSALIAKTEQKSVESTAAAIGRNAQALASIDGTTPNQVAFATLDAEIDDSYALDGSDWAASGVMEVAKGDGCAVLTMGATAAAEFSITACGDAAPDPAFELASAFVNAAFVDEWDTLVMPDPHTGFTVSGWTFEPNHMFLYDFAPWSMPDGTFADISDSDTGTADLFFQDGTDCYRILANGSDAYWTVPTETVWISQVPATAGQCPDAFSWDDYLPGGMSENDAVHTVYAFSDF